MRLSQEKSDEALQALRTFPPPPVQDADDPQSHALLLLNTLPIQTRIARAKLLLECSAYPDALALLEGVLAADDANVEGWYLMGWAWWLLAQCKKDGDVTAAELGEDVQQLEWQDMARDARDCLETCQTVGHFSCRGMDALSPESRSCTLLKGARTYRCSNMSRNLLEHWIHLASSRLLRKRMKDGKRSVMVTRTEM